MTTNDKSATCIYCGGAYAGERAEIGYAFCMKKECTTQGSKDKAEGNQVEFTWTVADTARF